MIEILTRVAVVIGISIPIVITTSLICAWAFKDE